jgi:hypothetical protein
MASGITVLRTIGEALWAGFEIYDRTATGYVVRARVNGCWQMALVEC